LSRILSAGRRQRIGHLILETVEIGIRAVEIKLNATSRIQMIFPKPNEQTRRALKTNSFAGRRRKARGSGTLTRPMLGGGTGEESHQRGGAVPWQEGFNSPLTSCIIYVNYVYYVG
jgi:hypothetical protein